MLQSREKDIVTGAQNGYDSIDAMLFNIRSISAPTMLLAIYSRQNFQCNTTPWCTQVFKNDKESDIKVIERDGGQQSVRNLT